MPESPRTGVDEDEDLIVFDPEGGIEHAVDAIDFDKMISRSDRSELISAATAGVIGDELRIGAVDGAARLDPIEILVGSKADFDRPRRAVAKNLVEIVLLEAQRPAAPDAGRNLARDRVHELREALAKGRRRLRRAKQ